MSAVGHDRRRVAAAAVSDLPAGARPDLGDGPYRVIQGRRAVGVASRGRGGSSDEPSTTCWTGRTGRFSWPRPAAADEATGPPPGHPRHDPAVAPPARADEV